MNEFYDDTQHQQYLAELRQAADTLKPSLDPQAIWWEIFEMIKPERIELLDEMIFCDSQEGTLSLLKMLVTNVGLAEVVKIAPVEIWQEALKNIDKD